MTLGAGERLGGMGEVSRARECTGQLQAADGALALAKEAPYGVTVSKRSTACTGARSPCIRSAIAR